MNHAPNYTAIELLKMTAGRFDLTDHARLLRTLASDKGWDLQDIRHLADLNLFGTMVQSLLLRVPSSPHVAPIYNFLGETLHNYEHAKVQIYTGKHHQNKKIDSSAFTNVQTAGMLRGAAVEFDAPSLPNLPASVRSQPIAIIGYGAAGIMISAALRYMGFANLHIYEKSEENLGIWRQKNVYQRSRNNPRALRFLGKALAAAPGPGIEVRDFLAGLIPKDGLLRKKRQVSKVNPKRLNHEIVDRAPGPQQSLSTDHESFKYPVVINCIGLGKPAPVSDISRMMSPTTESEDIGPRWQTTLDRESVDGKIFTFIGLGNSTAEMIRQIHDMLDQPNPPKMDYRILTHYPRDAVFNPDDYVDFNNKTYRVFRDLSKPNLVKFHGDLADFRDDYFRALQQGKIISDVTLWERYTSGRNGELRIKLRDRSKRKTAVEVLHDDQQYTLIGYEHPREDIENLGCLYDGTDKCAFYDYDGEFHRSGLDLAEERLHKGYFGFGSVLKAPHNPNAIVIPGMNFRIGDLLFGVIMRAMEAARTKSI